MNERIEIRPPKLMKVARFLALEVFLVPACVYAMLSGDRIEIRLFGLIGVAFFGLGGLCALYMMLSRTWSFALTDEGIQINGNSLGYKGSLIPWQDVEQVGIASVRGQKMVGIRLGSYERFLQSRRVSASHDYGVMILIGFLRSIGLASRTALVPDAEPREYAKSLHEKRETQEALKPWRGARSAADLLRGNRASCSFDVTFSWSDLDRAPQAMVDLITEHWQAARQTTQRAAAP
jgi:hypothetical protein